MRLIPKRPRASRSAAAHLVAMLTLAAGFLMLPGNSAAQVSIGEMRRQMTRAELEAAAKSKESAASSAPDAKTRDGYLADANAIRQRLRHGDFVPGDRILLQVIGDTVLSDTFTVRGDRMLRLPNLPDISLEGVLDAELAPYLTKELTKYIRNVEVTATGLLNVAVLGAVGRPGFMTVPTDQALTDVLTNAGGLTAGSDLTKATVKRGDKTYIDRKALQVALATGKTVGDIALRDGDQIHVPATSPGTNHWQQAIGIVSGLAGVFWLVRYGFGGGGP
jgi:hypothetical protein